MKSHRAGPGVPRLVMTWMTPFDASVPYRVVAAGPFTISTLSMSSGLKSLKREIELDPNAWFVGPVAKSASTRTPST